MSPFIIVDIKIAKLSDSMIAYVGYDMTLVASQPPSFCTDHYLSGLSLTMTSISRH